MDRQGFVEGITGIGAEWALTRMGIDPNGDDKEKIAKLIPILEAVVEEGRIMRGPETSGAATVITYISDQVVEGYEIVVEVASGTFAPGGVLSDAYPLWD